MRRYYKIQIAILIIFPILATAAWASMPADYDTVRLMLTAPDNQDMSMFDVETLVGVLVDIAMNDDPDAAYHDTVVSSALKWLGSMHAEEAVEPLIANIEDYTTTCIYWLGMYASPDGVDAIVTMLESNDESVRYEAAVALSTLPEGDLDNEEWVEALNGALAKMMTVGQGISTDDEFAEVMSGAVTHIWYMLEQ